MNNACNLFVLTPVVIQQYVTFICTPIRRLAKHNINSGVLNLRPYVPFGHHANGIVVASNDSSLIIWLIQSYVPQILFEIYSCASKQGFSPGRNFFLWDNCNTMINIVFSRRVKGKRIILIGHPATNGYIIIPLDNEVLPCVFVCLCMCVCICLSVCLSVYVCHDVCPDDFTMKDRCHTNNILQVHIWGRIFV